MNCTRCGKDLAGRCYMHVVTTSMTDDHEWVGRWEKDICADCALKLRDFLRGWDL